MITIVDYGLGNVQAFLNVYGRLNIDAKRATRSEELADAAKIILPGVGAFDHAMERLEQSGMRGILDELVLDKGVPVLGVCVGMQILTEASEEGERPGLGWIRGQVKRFESLRPGGDISTPHMGWNDVRPLAANRLFDQLETDVKFYFLHSYYVECAQPQDTIAVCDYGAPFSCAVGSRNIFGVQFHPEKSHHFGTQLLKNFAVS